MEKVSGKLHRFDSVAELLTLCRARFPGAEAHAVNQDGDFVLRVRGGAWHFESLIVHFEGEGCYAAMLPKSREDPRCPCTSSTT